MNNKMMSVLFAAASENKLNELTIHRTTASLPFGGRYRLVDFALSNLVNSGITRIGIITRNNYSSLMDHIRMGRDWDLNRKNSGIAVFPPFVLNTSREVYKGKIEALYTILDYIKPAPEDYVVVSNCNVAANVDFEAILAEHIKNNADITMLCHSGKITTSRRVVVGADEDCRVRDLYYDESPEEGEKLIGLNVYVIGRDLLCNLVEKYYSHGFVDFEKDLLFREKDNLRVFVHNVQGYAAIVDDVKTYYSESMKLLNKDVRDELFRGDRKIYTKVKDSVPTAYGENAVVKNSLIADGCVIEGSVENSILFRNVKIKKGAVIKDSIIMEDGSVMENSVLAYAITDKGVTIKENRQISGYETYPIVIVKNKVV